MKNRLTQDRPTLFVDHHQHIMASSLAELLAASGRTRATKMYRDTEDGRTVWIGYVCGGGGYDYDSWFIAYRRIEEEA